jgi:hypothetical protein
MYCEICNIKDNKHNKIFDSKKNLYTKICNNSDICINKAFTITWNLLKIKIINEKTYNNIINDIQEYNKTPMYINYYDELFKIILEL